MKNTFYKIFVAVVLVSVLFFGNTKDSEAVSPVTRLATATISPTSSKTNQSKTYTLAVARDDASTATAKVGSIDILLPVGYGAPTIGTITTDGGKTWTMESYNSGTRKIRLHANSNSDELDANQGLSFAVTATAPAGAGSYEWTTTVFANQNYTGNDFTVSEQPSVEVSTEAVASVSVTADSTTIEAPGNANLTFTLRDSNGDLISNGTPFSFLTTFGTVGGDATTINGDALRTLFSSQIGTATLSVNGITLTGDTTIHFVDTTAPVITLLGSDPVDVWVGTSYSDAGATALDAVQGDLTSSITTVNDVDADTLGTYVVTYNVTDSQNNVATEVTRTVNVVDAGSPIISLVGNSDVTIEINSSYSDEGATAEDNVDGDITANIVTTGLPVNTSVLGDTVITYNVSDQSGNHANQITRTVHVVDTTLPIITILGDATVNIKIGQTYTDAGATALDAVSGDLTSSIITTGGVDTNVAATYTITYGVSDGSGNQATASRTIIVRNPGVDANLSALVPATGVLNPSFDPSTLNYEILLPFEATDVVEVTPTTNDPFATIEVDEAKNIHSANESIRTTTIVVTAEDGVTTKTYTVLLTKASAPDTVAPVITITGNNPAYVNLGGVYTDAGATAEDAIDGTVSVQSNDNVNTDEVGTYTVTYTATDAATNTASATRTVIVRAPSSDASLSTLLVATGVLTPNFASSTLDYTVVLASDAENAPQVTATANDEGATVEILDATQITSENENLRTTRVIVTAQDGVTTTTYRIEFNPLAEEDAVLPVITILGENPKTITRGDAYVDAGATASDNVDGDITNAIKTENNVNTEAVGTYFVVYSVTDTSGNTTIESRTVTVSEPEQNNGGGGSSGGSSSHRFIVPEETNGTEGSEVGTNQTNGAVTTAGGNTSNGTAGTSFSDETSDNDGILGGEDETDSTGNTTASASTTNASQLAAIGATDASTNFITYLLELLAAGVIGYALYYILIGRKS